MLGKTALSLAAAAALTAGASLAPSQADASTDLLIKAHQKGHKGHKGHNHGRHGGHRWRHGWGPYSYGPWYGYGWGGCHWKKRPHRVRVWDGYYGWRYRTVWRPVRVCY